MFRNIIWAAALGLVACGGGGGGSSETLQLHFAQSPLAVSVYEWDIQRTASEPVREVSVDATVSGSTNASIFYVLIEDQGSVFKPGEATVQQTGTNSFQGRLPLRQNLSTGDHDGALKIRVCTDEVCAAPLASASLPYHITVAQNPSLSLIAKPGALFGKALWIAADRPPVTGFKIPDFTLQGFDQLPSDLRSPIYIRATDATGMVALKGWANGDVFYASHPSTASFPMDFSIARPVGQGDLSGTLQFQVCRDSDCRYQFNGNSSLPYSISVATGNYTALQATEGVPEWSQTGGNAAHTSYVPITVDPGALMPRWVSNIAQTDAYNYSVDIVTSAGNVFVSQETGNGMSAIYSLAESDASLRWQATLDGPAMSPMLAANGRVYATSVDDGSKGILHAFSALDGAPAFSKQTESRLANGTPLLLGDDVLIADTVQGPYGDAMHFNRYDGQTGALLSGPACLQDVEWEAINDSGFKMHLAPAISGEKAFVMAASGLEIIDFGDAQSCTNIAYGDLHFFTTEGVLAPSGNLLYLSSHCSSDVLNDIGTASYGGGWTSSMGDCSGENVAVAGNVVYALSTQGLEARSESTGQLLWTWQADGFDAGGTLLVTDNVLFIKAERLYAIDLSTHKVIWSMSPVAGQSMALSPNGILYLIDRPAYPATAWSLIAVNLR